MKLIRLPEQPDDIFEVMGENPVTGSMFLVNRTDRLRRQIESCEAVASSARRQLAELEAAWAAQVREQR